MDKNPEKISAGTSQVSIKMPELLVREWVEKIGASQFAGAGDIRLDFLKTRQIDSSGAAFVSLLMRTASGRGCQVVMENASGEISETIGKWCSFGKTESDEGAKDVPGYFTRVGDSGIKLYNECVNAFSVLTEMVYWGTIGLFRRKDIKAGALGDQMYQLGFRAIGIVGLLAFLIGVVLALQTAIQLRQFGADIFLAPMIGISMIRELGPLMTAIILAGRTGSATTAEIATMGVQEELDALKTMSINPMQFVIVPKFWAISLTMPCLSMFSVVTGIFGGFLVAVLYLGTAPGLFMGELFKNIFIKDFMAGFLKSIVFSWLIIWIGAYYGLKVKGGAEEVGRETTNSVVTCIFVIIMADAVFSFII
jgi:phospholipid/cholesterol/gamma-HCH transport system permease protein